ncbi:DMSO/selenate family reductase complex A subunit [Rubrivivax gelatinosus]|uniref:DMSO/selenate family reductase complex A subunit n=1 Tax=Rubrivivax gelatinosus TaxID=28068 RepID=UPI0018CAFA7D|nr:DMSO/selenate family reductase complex A subunit [Rubrivivax gelatinosus]
MGEQSAKEEGLGRASGLSRRSMLKVAGLVGLGAVGAGIGLPFMKTSIARGLEQIGAPEGEIAWNACRVNCGSRCPLKCHVVNGAIRWISQEDNHGSGDDTFGQHQVRACLRGRSARRRVYNPDRLKYPMKRVGKRGEGKFERISWDEAIKIVGDKLKHTIDTYGNQSIYYQYGSGSTGYNMAGRSSCHRFLNVIGGYLEFYNTYSTAQIRFALPFTYGEGYGSECSYTREIGNAKLAVFFGYNPGELRMSGGGETYQVNEWRRRNKVRTIFIDPRYSDSMLGKEDEWIPIRPGTDAALVNALAWVLIKEDLVDQQFLDNYCVGYDATTLPASAPANGSYKDYILGDGPDGIAKTPEWAARITGIPEARIVKLAREIGTAQPAFIAQGWSLQRHANGEQAARAVCMLPILTGNIGLPGTNIGEEPGSYGYPVPKLKMPANKVKVKIPCFLWTDAITRGKEMTALADGIKGADKLEQPIKFLWNYSSNTTINQHSDIQATHRILQDESLCEFILVIENHMTPTARYADVLLPDITNFEGSDIISNGYAVGEMGGPIFLSPAIKPLFECKSAWDICTLLARHLGVEQDYTEGKPFEQWLQEAYVKMREADPDLPETLAEARAMGMIKRRAPQGKGIGLSKFRADPVANPLKTPSGKIEIYSERLAEIAATWKLPAGDVITPLPQYVATWEGYEDTEARKSYPLQLYGRHPKGRTHSTYHNLDVLRAAVADAVWINPIDAQARGIHDGDLVRVTSARGHTRIKAKVTPRIIPGVASMEQGIWFKFDANGQDTEGSVNVLTSQRPSPLAKGNPQHTNRVQIEKI